MNKDQWNSLKTSERKRLLKEAGYQPNNYAYRAWDFVPHHIKIDINFVARREAAKAEVKHAA